MLMTVDYIDMDYQRETVLAAILEKVGSVL